MLCISALCGHCSTCHALANWRVTQRWKAPMSQERVRTLLLSHASFIINFCNILRHSTDETRLSLKNTSCPRIIPLFQKDSDQHHNPNSSKTKKLLTSESTGISISSLPESTAVPLKSIYTNFSRSLSSTNTTTELKIPVNYQRNMYNTIIVRELLFTSNVADFRSFHLKSSCQIIRLTTPSR